MRVAILTIVDNWENYGSILQMLALKNWLEMSGNEVFFVAPPKRLDMVRRDIVNYIGDYKIDRNKRLYVLRRINKCIRVPLFIVKTLVRQTYNRIRYNSMFHRIEIEKVRDVDVVILGSDTLWDVTNRAFQDSFYWGKEIFDYRVPIITYAVSADATEKLDIIKYPWIIECIPHYRNISVRDKHTKAIIEPYYSKSIAIVCDPTLLCPETLSIKKINIKKNYLLIYAFELTQTEIDCIKHFAKEENLIIVCAMGLRKYGFADINMDCGFDGFSEIVRQASYMYTSTFHGCMFSIIHNIKTMYKANSIKTKELIEKFNLSYRVFYDEMLPSEFSKTMKHELNINMLDETKSSFCKQSRVYLENILAEIKESKKDE